MSVKINLPADSTFQVAQQGCPSILNDLETDSSSCLSEIEEKELEGKADLTKSFKEVSEEIGNTSEDSEAETERLERSPPKYHTNQYVDSDSIHINNLAPVPSPVHCQSIPDGEYPISEDNLVDEPPNSLKSPVPDNIEEEPTSLDESAVEPKKSTSAVSPDTRKRKRSDVDETGGNEDEPSRKRTSSLTNPSNGYPIEVNINYGDDNPNSIPRNSLIEGENVLEDEPAEEIEGHNINKDDALKTPDLSISLRRREFKKKKHNEPDIIIRDVDPDKSDDKNTVVNNLNIKRCEKIGPSKEEEDEDEEEAETALRNEEEIERKKIALHQLIELEKQFSAFRDRLYEERLEQLNCEEAVLRQANPSHPGYLAMIRCIDARQDERIRKADKLREYEMESLKKVAVAQRSQILVQYQQEVRDVREKKLELLGEQWYKIQHDRRTYSGVSPEYILKFPTKKSQQITNHIAYSSEVSILSGIAKYVGFPAAPTIAPASAAELEEDLEKMGRSMCISQAAPGLSIHELAALHGANSTSSFRPAEEQFIEKTPWANPQHPFHAHLVNKQLPTSQIPRTTSPFSQTQIQSCRQTQANGIASNTRLFSNAVALHQLSITADRISTHNQFGNSKPKAPPDVPISIPKTSSCK
ncbi:hypothetical protein K3495_g7392 [Podosphaera aphanis]|nr:hypothetical protein K3495_g7392 [Podosphaera aphanis]